MNTYKLEVSLYKYLQGLGLFSGNILQFLP